MKKSCVKSCRRLTLQAFAFGVCLMSAAVSYAAEPVERVWVGGVSGSAKDATNWDTQVVPTSTATPYVIVFTNSVTVLNDHPGGYWYLQGIKVRDNAAVIIKGVSGNNRIQTWNVKSDGFVVDVGEGCSLTHAKGDANDYAFYGLGRPVIKTGNGVFKTGSRMGWGSENYISSLEVREGILDCSIADVRVKGEIKVCSGATLKVKSSGVVAGASGDATLLPWLNVAEGGVFDGCGANQRLLGLEGAGTVTNVSDLSLTMKYTEKVFSGRIRADILSVTNNSWTTSGALMVLGSADTLQGVKRWRFTNDDAVPMEIRFAAGIETAAVGGSSYPTDRTFFNLDGMPVQLEYVNAAWYVDDDNYGKSGDGTTPEKAFGTLQEAMDNELLENYDTVYVLPGTYDKGGKPYGSYSTTNRVIVPAYVRLVATGSPEETVIVGRSSTDAAKDGLGNGPGAIRCVTLVGNTSSIRGFTLTGGRVTVTDKETGSEDGFGGAVWGGGNGAMVADCIISNNAAVRAGGVRNCTSVRCIATGNRASSNLGSVWHGVCDLYGCVEYGNPSSTKYAYYSVNEGRRIVNCTFGPGQTYNFRVIESSSVILNSVFLGGIHTAEAGTYSNCVFACNLDGNLVNADEDCVIGTGLETPDERLAFAGLDADLRPLKGGLVVDRGVNAYYGTHRMSGSQSSGPFDIAGAQRVSNGMIDIGAYEYDWRGDYTRLSGGGTRMSVNSATAGVVTNETGFVLADRDVVKVSCRKKTGIYSVHAKVTGSGTLTVSVDGCEGQTLTEADGQTRLSFDVPSVPAGMRLGFDGEGKAEITKFAYPVFGLVLVVQ